MPGTENITYVLRDGDGDLAGSSLNITVTPVNDAPEISLNNAPNANVRDEFQTVAYTNNNGTANWAGNWTETGDDGNAAIDGTGDDDIRIVADANGGAPVGNLSLRLFDDENGDSDGDDADASILRTVNLTGRDHGNADVRSPQPDVERHRARPDPDFEQRGRPVHDAARPQRRHRQRHLPVGVLRHLGLHLVADHDPDPR